MNKIKPKRIQKGDVIGIISPAAPFPEESKELAASFFQNKGFKVKFASNTGLSRGYLAGDDKARADALVDLWLDPEVSALWNFRGGYGCTRILKMLDFKKLKETPKIFIGMSDITALHLALGEQISLVTFLGPVVSSCFKEKEEMTFRFLQEGNLESFSFKQEDILKEGVGQGELIGGNLSLITSLIGTPYQIKAHGKILVLEDWNEAPYRVDRMLCQLDLAGVLDCLHGVILGRFIGGESKQGLTLEEVFYDYFFNRSYPVILNFPTGHFESQTPLPLGCDVRINTHSKIVEILENPFCD